MACLSATICGAAYRSGVLVSNKEYVKRSRRASPHLYKQARQTRASHETRHQSRGCRTERRPDRRWRHPRATWPAENTDWSNVSAQTVRRDGIVAGRRDETSDTGRHRACAAGRSEIRARESVDGSQRAQDFRLPQMRDPVTSESIPPRGAALRPGHGSAPLQKLLQQRSPQRLAVTGADEIMAVGTDRREQVVLDAAAGQPIGIGKPFGQIRPEIAVVFSVNPKRRSPVVRSPN